MFVRFPSAGTGHRTTGKPKGAFEIVFERLIVVDHGILNISIELCTLGGQKIKQGDISRAQAGSGSSFVDIENMPVVDALSDCSLTITVSEQASLG